MTVATTTPVASLRRELAAALERAFAGSGREGTPALDARLLVAHALGVDASALALHDDAPVDPRAEAKARAFVARRVAGEPVARIVGRKEFWGLDFILGPDTLVPRPDTETVVEAALGFVDSGAAVSGSSPAERGRGTAEGGVGGGFNLGVGCSPLRSASRTTSPVNGGGTGVRSSRQASLKILDIGTGSGAILIALLTELPDATGIGTDLSEGVLAVARENAARLGVGTRATFICSDWAAAVAGPFDVVLSNPPYIETGVIPSLPVEVALHDPHVALDGGVDGLDAYRALLSDLGRLLAKGGKAFLEIGRGQGPAVAALAAGHGFRAGFHRDLAGVDRVAEIGRVGDG